MVQGLVGGVWPRNSPDQRVAGGSEVSPGEASQGVGHTGELTARAVEAMPALTHVGMTADRVVVTSGKTLRCGGGKER